MKIRSNCSLADIRPMKNPETVRKVVETRRKNGNYVFSEETREKMRQAKLGVTPWNKGKRKLDVQTEN